MKFWVLTFFLVEIILGAALPEPEPEPEPGLVDGLLGGGGGDSKSIANYVHIPLARRFSLNILNLKKRQELRKRESFVSTLLRRITGNLQDSLDQVFHGSLENRIYEYIAHLDVGTPPQKAEASLDTGSSDLWIFGPKAAGNNFQTSKSSTYQYISDDFDIKYVSGDAKGDWVKDTVKFGDAEVKEQQFAIVNEVNEDNFDAGIFGVGMVENEASTDKKYPNFPAQLKKQGMIKRNVYSLYLNGADENAGAIIFGGIDHAKYTGDLIEIDLSSPTTVAFQVNATLPAYSKETFSPILDCGTTFSYVPIKIADEIAKKYGATYNSEHGVYYTDKKPNNAEPVEFKFDNGASIKVNSDELFLDASIFSTLPPKKYAFAITKNEGMGDLTLLGDSFLRSAYVVYDIDRRKISLAQAIPSTSKSDVRPVN